MFVLIGFFLFIIFIVVGPIMTLFHVFTEAYIDSANRKEYWGNVFFGLFAFFIVWGPIILLPIWLATR